jgi:hypothetical protein
VGISAYLDQEVHTSALHHSARIEREARAHPTFSPGSPFGGQDCGMDDELTVKDPTPAERLVLLASCELHEATERSEPDQKDPGRILVGFGVRPVALARSESPQHGDGERPRLLHDPAYTRECEHLVELGWLERIEIVDAEDRRECYRMTRSAATSHELAKAIEQAREAVN